MLNWEQIAQRIQHPALCTKDDLTGLKELCDKYPYSQVFPMVYLKALSDGKHIQFEEELENYAFRITDRVQLYDLLHSYDERQEKLDSLNETTIDISTIEQEIIPDNQGVELVQSISDEHDGLSHLDSEFDKDLVSSEINQPTADELDYEIEDESPEELGIDELEKQIHASSLSANYQLDEWVEPNEGEEGIEFDLSIVDEVIESTADDIIKNSMLGRIELGLDQPRSFLDWLKEPSSISNFHTDELDESELTYIEFEKPKRAFFSPVKIAKESLSEETLPVSETLAKIFEIQGNIPKAIYVYQQLGLIIPEKKSYFASQIRKLKKNLN